MLCVGGDGTLTECVNGLVMAAANKESVDLNNPATSLVKTAVPLGVIPTGTGNMMSGFFYQSKDAVTAVLYILQGNCRKSLFIRNDENVLGSFTHFMEISYNNKSVVIASFHEKIDGC